MMESCHFIQKEVKKAEEIKFGDRIKELRGDTI